MLVAEVTIPTNAQSGAARQPALMAGLRLQERDLPTLPPGGALLALTGCGLCGSDLDKLRSLKVPEGTVLGHEVVGRILALADDHRSPFQVGDRVVTSHHVPCGVCHYCRNDSESMCRQFKVTRLDPGGFAEVIALSAAHLQQTVQGVPSNLSDAEASCMEPLACVLRGVNRTRTLKNGAVAVVGLGFIGLLAAQLYRLRGDRVIGLDPLAVRRELALREGWVSSAWDPMLDSETLRVAVQHETVVGGVDIVFLTVLNQASLDQALALVRDGGQILVFAGAGAVAPQLDLNALYFREISLITSYSPSLADQREALMLMARSRVSVKPLVQETLPLTDIQQAVERYGRGEAIKLMLTIPAEGAMAFKQVGGA
ncbi:MAG: alcohol dehydrogenase catalytic domain-containing protein [Candidatus Melainabacteria bacterium]